MSYDDSDLTTPLNAARALLGDTSNVDATELLTDDHIEAALALYSFNGGVAFMATGLAARFARKPTDVSLPSGLRAAWGKRVDRWVELAADMRNGGVTGTYAAFSRTPARMDGYSIYQAELDAQ